MLYFKGYQAVQVHRIAHELWLGERNEKDDDDDGEGGDGNGNGNEKKKKKSGVRTSRVMARMLQSRVSEVFAVDIHPAATLGRGLLLDHGTGVVIGVSLRYFFFGFFFLLLASREREREERNRNSSPFFLSSRSLLQKQETAVVGDNVSILQNVTLGGTGKDAGDRHPKVEDNVLIGAAATILGNITVGRGAQVAAGSLVLKPVPPRTAVAGSPAQVVGLVRGNPALKMQQWVASLDGKAAPAWESAMCPPPAASPQAASPQSAGQAAASPQASVPPVSEINARLYPRRAEESPFLPVAPAEVKAAKSPAASAAKKPAPPPPPPPRPKPKQPPPKREQEPEFFI